MRVTSGVSDFMVTELSARSQRSTRPKSLIINKYDGERSNFDSRCNLQVPEHKNIMSALRSIVGIVSPLRRNFSAPSRSSFFFFFPFFVNQLYESVSRPFVYIVSVSYLAATALRIFVAHRRVMLLSELRSETLLQLCGYFRR